MCAMTTRQGFFHLQPQVFLDCCVDFSLLWVSTFSSFIRLLCQTVNWLRQDLNVFLKVISIDLVKCLQICVFMRLKLSMVYLLAKGAGFVGSPPSHVPTVVGTKRKMEKGERMDPQTYRARGWRWAATNEWVGGASIPIPLKHYLIRLVTMDICMLDAIFRYSARSIVVDFIFKHGNSHMVH